MSKSFFLKVDYGLTSWSLEVERVVAERHLA